MAGLPGAGKSALADALGRALPAPVLSVDPIEAAMLRAGVSPAEPTGLAAYVVAEAIADRLLALGQTVIVDAVNAVEPAREQWRALARRHGVPLRFLEVRCDDRDLHRRRLTGRRRGLEGIPEPSWDSVEARREAFAGWTEDRLVLDSTRPLPEILAAALADLAGQGRAGR